MSLLWQTCYGLQGIKALISQISNCKKVTNLAYFHNFEKHRKTFFSDDLVKNEDFWGDLFLY